MNRGGSERPFTRLSKYFEFKLAVAGQLRIAKALVKSEGNERAEEKLAELMAKLATDKLVLTLLGESLSGKSSIINALAGQEVLPAGKLNPTSVITRLRYGPADQAIIDYQHSIFPEYIPLASLSEYVTQRGNPDNIKNIKNAVAELPVSFLKPGLEFIDTPGLSSKGFPGKETFQRMALESDALLFVTGNESSMDLIKKEYAEYIGMNSFGFFIILIQREANNKEGPPVGTEDFTMVLPGPANNVFPLQVKKSHTPLRETDVEIFDLDGLNELEDALVSFLWERKRIGFFLPLIQEALHLLNGRDSSIRRNELVGINQFSNAGENQKMDSVVNRLVELGELITGTGKPELVNHFFLMNDSMADKSTLRFNLPHNRINMPEDMKLHTCPVCRHIIEYMSVYFGHWQYLLAEDEKARELFARKIGFCPMHNWQLISVSSPYGSSIGFSRLAREMADHISRLQNSMDSSLSPEDLIPRNDNCMACKESEEVEQELVNDLCEKLKESSGLTQYEKSQGVCLPHLTLLLRTCSDAELKQRLIDHTSSRFTEDANDMGSYLMKIDAVRKDMLFTNEENAWRRIILRMVGDRNVYLPGNR